MWNFLTGYGFGGAFGASRLGRRIVKTALKLFFLGIVIAGLIYVFVIFKAVSERSSLPHVHTRSIH